MLVYSRWFQQYLADARMVLRSTSNRVPARFRSSREVAGCAAGREKERLGELTNHLRALRRRPRTLRFSVAASGSPHRCAAIRPPESFPRSFDLRSFTSRSNQKSTTANDDVGNLQEFHERHRQVRAREAAAFVETSSWSVKWWSILTSDCVTASGTCIEKLCVCVCVRDDSEEMGENVYVAIDVCVCVRVWLCP